MKKLFDAVSSCDGEDTLLGATEMLDAVTRDKMAYTAVVHRQIEIAGRKVGVYLGYWGPKVRPVSFVAAHTPDRCWPLAGYRLLSHGSFPAGPARTQDVPQGEWRKFLAPSGQSIEVSFWHIVGAAVRAPVPDPSWRSTLLGRAFIGAVETFTAAEEQLFVRITSDVQFNELSREPDFIRLLTLINQCAADQRYVGGGTTAAVAER